MSRPSRNQGPPAPAPATTRQNEYFVPRDGIDREVISADICRYLGNDALVRPGHYENPQTGQVVQGYYITAYRNLTTAMIEDLKADSARWDSERRAQTSRNTSGVQYRYSETHQSRQHHGPTDNAYPDPYARDSGYDGPRYPGSGAPGYTGAIGSYPPAAQQQQQQPYGSSSGSAYPNYQSPPTDPRYAQSQGSSMYQGQDGPYIAAGANMPVGYASPNDPYAARTGSSASGPQQPAYPSTASSQAGYPTPVSSYSYNSQVPPPTSQQAYAAVQPHDPFYGRASPAGQTSQTQQGYPAQGQQSQQQYETTPHSRSAASTAANAQASSAGNTARRNDREADRHSTDRHHRAPRR